MPLTAEKTRIRQAFSDAAARYDFAAQLQRTVARDLLSAVDAAGLRGTLLDIGCGTGFLTEALLAAPGCSMVIALDMALPMLKTARQKSVGHEKLRYVCADAEALPLATHSIDQAFSNLALQWCDCSAVLRDIRRVLKPDGRLAFSTFGAQTLCELKAAWAAVDDYRHVNDFYRPDELALCLQQAGFRNVRISSVRHRPCYDSVLSLLRELKAIGAHNVQTGRNRRLTGKAALHAMIAAYPSAGGDRPITATFEVITVTAMR